MKRKTFALEDEQVEELERIHKVSGTNPSTVVRKALKEYLERNNIESVANRLGVTVDKLGEMYKEMATYR